MSGVLDAILPARETPWAAAECRKLLARVIDQQPGDPIEDHDPITIGVVAQLAVALLAKIAERSRQSGGLMLGGVSLFEIAQRIKTRASQLVRTEPILDVAALARLVTACTWGTGWIPVAPILSAVERALGGKPPQPKLRDALTALQQVCADDPAKPMRDIAERVSAMFGAVTVDPTAVAQVDAWTIALAGALERMPATRRAAVQPLLVLAAKASQTRPSKAWLVEAKARVGEIGAKAHAALLAELLAAVGTAAPFRIEMLKYGGHHHGDPKLLHDRYTDLLRGLVWSAIVGDTAALVVPIGDCAERCFKKLAGHGPLQPKIGNACLQVLSQVPSDAAVGQLTRLKMRAKHASVRKLLDKAVTGASERTGLAPEELEEVGAPTCGLDELGRRVVKLAGGTGELRIGGDDGVELRWLEARGKPLRAPPKADARVAELERAYKELAGVVPAQRVRLERLLLAERSWPMALWRERYADHLLVGALARRLIWWIGDRLASFDGARLVDLDGKKLALGKTAQVRLWHPLESKAKVVRAWRTWLDEHAVTQPFKQAHREIYALTDAERRTRTYSNRFAAHVLRQHQFAALLHERGWRYTLQGNWDSHNTPYVELPGGWRVELSVNPGSDDDTTGAGIHRWVGTDRVTFARDGREVALADVPPLLFSEAMRDVDLFVGVSSIGADPTWQDGGDRHRDYWQRFASGELDESARVRHEVLERVVPRLAIASRCTLAERFLQVRGQLRTYRIHLGSGAIQMEPDSQYLCIVPSSAGVDGVQLPFEGDRRLSEILSKAVLLAADDRIRDPSIRQQIAAR